MIRGVFVRRKMPEPLLPPDSAIRARFAELIAGADRVFFAGLPGVGKSLLLQQMALMAAESGRAVTLLQWDVLRQPFETPRYPLQSGATHPLVIQAAGTWLRAALPTLECDLLIGELPLVGGRLMELARPVRDAAEPVLRDARTQFVIPAPSREVRAVIESRRQQTIAAPSHQSEADDAPPNVLRALWRDLRTLAQEMELAGRAHRRQLCAGGLRGGVPALAAASPCQRLARGCAAARDRVRLHAYGRLASGGRHPAEAQKTLRHVEANPDAGAWWDI